MKSKLLLILSVFIVAISSHAQNFDNEWKLVPNERTPGNGSYFGASITTLSSNQIIIGAPNEKTDVNGQNSLTKAGAAYVFQLQPSGLWKQAQKITLSDRDSNNELGKSIAASDSFFVAGVDGYGSYGAAFIYKKDAQNNWTEIQKFVPPASFPKGVGAAVAMDKNYMIVGANKDSRDANESSPVLFDAGAAFILENDGNGNWVNTQKIVASDREANAWYGSSVALNGNIAVVGAYSKEEEDHATNTIEDRVGAAYVYKRNVSGVWEETHKLTASDKRKSDSFGGEVYADTNCIIISATSNEYNENNQYQRDYAGAVYVFEKDGNGDWLETQKLVADYRSEDAFFGNSITMQDTLLIIGAFRNDRNYNNLNVKNDAGAIYIFDKDENGIWKQINKITASDRDSYDNFGKAVAATENFIFSGAWYEDHDENGENEVLGGGSVYVYGCISTIQTEEIACDSFISPKGNIYTETGIYYDTLINASLCDSIITIDLTVGKTYNIDTTDIVCDSIIWEGDLITTSGTYDKTLNSIYGCDSIVTYHITVNKSSVGEFDDYGCESYTWNDSTYAQSGRYTQVLANNSGCDSIVTLNLTINHRQIDTTATACNFFFWKGKEYTETGTYVDTMLNAQGCDTTFTRLQLTVNQNTTSVIDTSTCGSYISPSGRELNTSDTYTDTIANSVACDSIITINLIINNATESTIDTTVCNAYFSPSGKEWTTSDTYTDTIANTLMCDSIITINLIVDTLNLGVIRRADSLICQQAGASYKWLDCNNNNAPINGQIDSIFTFTENGSYSVEVTNGSCIDTSECVTVTDVSVTKYEKDIFINIYPNPVKNNITISLNAIISGVVRVLNVDGKEILTKQTENTSQIQLSVSNLKTGIYFIEIVSEEGKHTLRFVKE